MKNNNLLFTLILFISLPGCSKLQGQSVGNSKRTTTQSQTSTPKISGALPSGDNKKHDFTQLGRPGSPPSDLINEKQFEKGDLASTNRLYAPGDLALPTTQRRMQYDAAGNLTNDTYTETNGGGGRIYDAENRMTQAWANGQWQVYTYNADGQRTRRKVNGVETWQVYGFEGELLAEYLATSPVVANPQKEYGYRNGQLLITAEPSTSGTGTPPETVWVDDSLPAGAVAAGSDESWNWVSSNPTPSSGSVAHQSNIVGGLHQHFFYNATSTLSVGAGEKLFVYVYLDPANPPSELMLQWNDGNWEHRAYWGANNIAWGTDGTNSRRSMGPLPATGGWTRLEVAASQVGLEGRTLNGMAFTLYGGRATWDRAGKASAASPAPAPAVPTVINGSFESPAVGGGSFQYGPTSGTWTFAGGSGVSGNSSAFTAGNPGAPAGAQVAFIQGGNTSIISQAVSGFETGQNYSVQFKAAQRGNCCGTGGQDFDLYLDTTLLGTFKPNSTSYEQLSTSSFPTTPGSHILKFVGRNLAGGDNTAFLDDVRITVASAQSASSATFVTTDTTTQGNWNGVYGADGYNVINAAANDPAYAQVSVSGQSSHTWAASTSDARALLKAGSTTDRLASCWYSGTNFTIDVNLTDNNAHRVAIYTVDWDGNNVRTGKIEVLDAVTNAVLDTRSLSSYSNGKYFVWQLRGHVKIKVTHLSPGGWNEVVSGLFFDPTATVGAANINWLVADQLGTPRMVFDKSGSLSSTKRHDYLPFGEELFAGGRTPDLGYSASDGVRQKFTLKERDIETGLDYFLARYYSSTQGRFTSPDEFTGGPVELFVRTGDSKKQALPYAEITQPQSLNKYTYVYNNPCRYIDPDGHCGTPSGLKAGQVGICVASFIASKLVWGGPGPTPGRGDGRGPNGQGGTSRVEVRVAVDVNTGSVTKTDETMGRSGIVFKDVGPKGSGGSDVSSPNKDENGNIYFQIHQVGTSNTPAGLIGPIENHLNLVVTPEGKVGITPSSAAKDYPSLEVYKYTVDDKGNVTTTLIKHKPESGNVYDLRNKEKPIKADPQ